MNYNNYSKLNEKSDKTSKSIILNTFLLSCKDIQPFKNQIPTSNDEGLKEMKLWFESTIKTKNLRLQKKRL